MVKPWKPADNRPDTPAGIGGERERAGAAEVEAEERGGKQGGEAVDPHPPPSLAEVGTKLRSDTRPHRTG